MNRVEMDVIEDASYANYKKKFPSSQYTEFFCGSAFFNTELERKAAYSFTFGKELAFKRLELQLLKRGLHEKKVQLKYVRDYYNAVTSTKDVDEYTVHVMTRQKKFIEDDVETLKEEIVNKTKEIKDYVEFKRKSDEKLEKQTGYGTFVLTKQQQEERDQLIKKISESNDPIITQEVVADSEVEENN